MIKLKTKILNLSSVNGYSVLLFILIPFVYASVGMESFQVKKEYLNKQLIGHAILEIIVKHIHECARECFSLALCKSIDYYRGRCKLNDADSLSVTASEFENQTGAIFSDIGDWPNVSKLLLLLLLLQCSSVNKTTKSTCRNLNLNREYV